jgi:hypothetical protein
MLLALACAWLVDASAAASGTVRYAAAPLGWAPPWIMALWAAFAMTLTTSMRFLQRHPALPALFGLLLAPLAYLSAARGFDAVRFTIPHGRTAGAGRGLEHCAFPAVPDRPSRHAHPAAALRRSVVMINLMWVLLYAVLVMSWGWAWQRRHRNIGVVDVLWARAGASALLLALLGDGAACRGSRWACSAACGAVDSPCTCGTGSVTKKRTDATATCANTGTATRARSSASSWRRRC